MPKPHQHEKSQLLGTVINVSITLRTCQISTTIRTYRGCGKFHYEDSDVTYCDDCQFMALRSDDNEKAEEEYPFCTLFSQKLGSVDTVHGRVNQVTCSECDRCRKKGVSSIREPKKRNRYGVLKREVVRVGGCVNGSDIPASIRSAVEEGRPLDRGPRAETPKAEPRPDRDAIDVLIEDFMIPRELNQAALAKLCRVSQATISKVIRRITPLTPVVAERLAEGLGTSVDAWV